MAVPSLKDRVAGESLMIALRSSMAAERSPSRSATLFGRNPIPAHSRSWYVGALGELAVAEQLRSLPAGWLVLHSVPVGSKGSDIDHVLVSPSGRVLTVNTKHSPGGTVWVSPKAFLVNGHRQPYLRNSQHEAQRAAKLVAAAAGGHVDALAVIVVVGASLTHKGEPTNVAVVTLAQLVRFLNHRLAPARTDTPVEAIRSAVAQPQTWAKAGEPTETAVDHLLWFLDLRDRVRAAQRRRVQWMLGAVTAFVGAPFLFGVLALFG